MGRAAGHLALGIGKAAAATLTIIPEEFGLDADGKPNKISFKHLLDIMVGAIIKREANKKRYGVIVLAEGLIESVREELKSILGKTHGRYGNYETDAFGHLRLGEIEFGKLIREMLTERLHKRKEADGEANDQPQLHDLLGLPLDPCNLKVTFVDLDLGYVLRCADPIPFDAEYTRDLGYSAVKFLLSEAALKYGAVIGFNQGVMEPTPFEKMINPKTKRMQTRIVKVNGEGYEVARRYMIRLEKRDFADPETVAQLAAVIKKSPDQFRAEFEYLV
jgi:6-phosphofructokinase 1